MAEPLATAGRSQAVSLGWRPLQVTGLQLAKPWAKKALKVCGQGSLPARGHRRNPAGGAQRGKTRNLPDSNKLQRLNEAGATPSRLSWG